MKNQIAVNDRVQALDDDFEGIVVAIEEDMVDVESSDGFVVRFRESELIPAISAIDARNLSRVSQSAILEKEEKTTKKKGSLISNKKKKQQPPMEVDLHINKLVRNARGMSNYEILNLQLETAKRQIEFAKTKKIQRVVLIHGVGEGVLKEELYYLLRRYENLNFYDADYQKYGVGATEVYFTQKGLNTSS
jgi:AAA+ superfamily predicted ATPase